MDNAKRAIGEAYGHGETVIGVEFIVTDPLPSALSKAFRRQKTSSISVSVAVDHEIKNVHADVAERAVGPMFFRQAP